MGLINIPSPSLDDLSKADPVARETARRSQSILTDMGVRSDVAAHTAGQLGGLVNVLVSAADAIIGLWVQIIDPLVRLFLGRLLKARQQAPEEASQIAAAALSEYFGTDIPVDAAKPGQGADGGRRMAETMGNAFIGSLSERLKVGSADDLSWAEENAKVFAGLGINFGVQNTLMAVLADSLSFHYLEDFRELGAETAQNIGLSRLMRVALQPLVQNAISKPYDKLLRQKFRQDDISEGDLVKAMQAGFLTRDQVNNSLAKKGYPDDQINILVELLTPRLSEQELFTLLRHQVITQDQAVQELMRAGIPEQTAQLRLQAIGLQKADTLENAYVTELATLVKDGFIDTDTAAQLLQQTHLTEEEQHMVAKRWGLWLEYPHKRITLAELQTSVEDELLTLDDLRTWANQEGYSDLDELILEYLTLKKKDAAAAKAAAAAQKAAKSATKKTPKPPNLG